VVADTPQDCEGARVSDDTLPVGQSVHEFHITGLAWSDETGHVYEVCSRQSFAGDDLDDDSDQPPLHEMLLRELMPPAICQRAEKTDRVVTQSSNKILFEKCRERFLAEAKALLALGTCPGLLQVLRVFEHNGTAYQLLEKPAGQSLRSRIDGIKQGQLEKFSTRELSEILSTVLNGLNRAHSVNLLHRNINPDCIFLDEKNGARLGDFYAAGQVLRSHRRHNPQPGGQKFAPVELSLERGNQGCWSDLYALGGCLYEAIALTPPAVAALRFEQMQSNQTDSYVPLRVILESMYPARLLEAVDWMLKTNIRSRPKSVAELADFLGFELASRPTARVRSGSRAGLRTLRRSGTAWQVPIVRRLWRSRQRFKPLAAGDNSTNGLHPSSELILDPVDEHLLDVTPPRKQRLSPGLAAALVAMVFVSAGVFFFYTDSPQTFSQTPDSQDSASLVVVSKETKADHPLTPAATATQQAAAAEPGPRPLAQSPDPVDTGRQAVSGQDTVASSNRVANDQIARNRAKQALAPMQGVRRDRFVARHMGEADQAWRDGRLLVPGKGSVLRHLERVIDVDPGNEDALAGVNHLLHHFIDELQKAEASGDAVAIRYLNRNIRRVRLRHPASVPKSHQRFASLPAPPPPSTRMAGVAAANLRPDYTE